MTQLRTRFAPSPTGSLHLGSLRTALYSYALAKHTNGEFILRIEDTDIKREVAGSKERIKELLKLFGLEWDEFYIQSERAKKGIYEQAAKKLVEAGHAFYCDCQAKNAKEGYSKELRDPCRDKKKTSGAIKLKAPEDETISFNDFVLGKEVSWDSSTVADATLLKSNGFPTYHLAVVVDDYQMKISHVLRGHDWLPSTPIHLLVYQYLGYKIPEIGHLTDILDPQGGKLSKRKGSASVDGLLEEGYLPEAILNFIMLLGWAPKDNQELFTLEEFVEAFDPNGFQKANPVFNKEKLDWFNGEYIRKLTDSELCSKFEALNSKFQTMDKNTKIQITKLVQNRIKKLSDFDALAGFFFKWQKPAPGMFGKNHQEHLMVALKAIEGGKDLEDTAKEKKFNVGGFFMDLRIAVAGGKITPPINESIVILGKEETLARLREVISDLKI
jgi:glutamyl-tRNA synthetase